MGPQVSDPTYPSSSLSVLSLLFDFFDGVEIPDPDGDGTENRTGGSTEAAFEAVFLLFDGFTQCCLKSGRAF